MRSTFLALSLMVASIASAASTKAPDDFVEISAGTPITLRPDRAYLLFRTNSRPTKVANGLSPVFLRVPTAEEMEVYEAAKRSAFEKAQPELNRRRDQLIAKKAKAIPPVPSLENFDFVYEGIRNVYSANVSRALEKPEYGRVMLIEVLPGEYVLYGWGQADLLHTCLCLGTVSFPAEAGKITDLGTLFVALAADPSPIPELKTVTGLGPTMNGHVGLWASALKPADASTAVPAVLAGKPIEPAAYRATGKFVSPFAFLINRLVPIPGVLGYDGGTVLDLVRGRPAEDHYH